MCSSKNIKNDECSHGNASWIFLISIEISFPVPLSTYDALRIARRAGGGGEACSHLGPDSGSGLHHCGDAAAEGDADQVRPLGQQSLAQLSAA